ncbi:hypothetical protein ACXYTJ_05900 [Gilvimarinus sp. F26214L]|uniref:hypothetical protein n=1 Tax=Gilvimarinus sp. DZF01 TaxID=3461371 RepID=UPI00404601C2
MIIRLFFAIIVIIALVYAFNRFRQKTPGDRKQLLFKAMVYLTVGAVLLLIVTGRVHWITALFAGLVPFLSRLLPLAIRLLPFVSQLQKQRMAGRMAWGDRSVLHTRFLRVEINQNSGAITGEVLSGPFAGKTLSELNRSQFEELMAFYRAEQDADSLNLLQAFAQQNRGGYGFENGGSGDATSRSGMSRREALEILGLDEGAKEADVLAAHKKLMQRLHPDRGGSNYLAAKVNQAKDFLISKV